MYLTDVLNLPEALVVVVVEGVSSLGEIKGEKYHLNVNEVEEATWQGLSGRIEERDKNNTLVRMYLGDGVNAVSIKT